MRRFTLLILLCAAMLGDRSAHSTTWHVRKDGTGDTVYLVYALYYAQPGDTVLVGPGLYQQPRIYLGAIHLISESGPESTILELYPQILEEDVIVITITAISSCSIIGFTIRGAAQGMLDSGGGIQCLRSHAIIKNNIITSNWCASGGGIACYGSPAPIIEGNLIFGNQAFSGGAIIVNNCSPIIRNNTITDNYASILGGAIHILGNGSYPTISNNIIVNNGSESYGGILSSIPSSQVTFACNDIWNNTPSNYCDSLVDQTGLNGNISADPLFCGVAGSGNYYLQAYSSCAAGNTPTYCSGSGMGCYPVNCTMGTKRESWGNIKSLFKREKK